MIRVFVSQLFLRSPELRLHSQLGELTNRSMYMTTKSMVDRDIASKLGYEAEGCFVMTGYVFSEWRKTTERRNIHVAYTLNHTAGISRRTTMQFYTPSYSKIIIIFIRHQGR